MTTNNNKRWTNKRITCHSGRGWHDHRRTTYGVARRAEAVYGWFCIWTAGWTGLALAALQVV